MQLQYAFICNKKLFDGTKTLDLKEPALKFPNWRYHALDSPPHTRTI